MEDNFESIISTTNEVYDSIWLGDLNAARDSAKACIERFGRRKDISEFENTATEMKAILKEARSEAREKKINKSSRRLWVLQRVSERIRKKELDSTKGILGVLWIHLQSLAEAVDFLVKTENQKTLDDPAESNAPGRQILRRGDRRRYSLNRLPDGWEVRAVLDTSVDVWDLKRLRSILSESFQVEEILREASSDVVELYSRDMYLQILRQGRVIRMTIHAPRTAEIDDRIDNLADIIPSSLIV